MNTVMRLATAVEPESRHAVPPYRAASFFPPAAPPPLAPRPTAPAPVTVRVDPPFAVRRDPAVTAPPARAAGALDAASPVVARDAAGAGTALPAARGHGSSAGGVTRAPAAEYRSALPRRRAPRVDELVRRHRTAGWHWPAAYRRIGRHRRRAARHLAA